MQRYIFLLILAGLLSTRPALASQTPLGKWQTLDEKTGKVNSDIEIYERGGILYGKIVDVPEPNDNRGKPKVCNACTGTDKDRPIVGLVILKDFKASGERYKGTILDPRDGKIYTAEIWVEDNTLKVRGYVGFFFQTRTWIKGT